MSSEQPTINEKGLVTLVHILGSILFFIPSVCVFFLMNNLSENSKMSIKTALNYQLSVTLCLIVLFAGMNLLGMLGFIFYLGVVLFYLTYSVVIIANIIISIMAGLSYYKDETVKYPPYFEFLK